MAGNCSNTMTRRQIRGYQGAGVERVEILGLAFGDSSGHIHSTSGFPDGAHIAGGRFVIDSPKYILDEYGIVGSRQHRSITLPDCEGKNLFHNDRQTDYSDIIDASKNEDGLFHFIGVSLNGTGTCKRECDVHPCCPIGYEDIAQRHNYWPRLGEAVDIATQGYVTVYAEKPISQMDHLHVRVCITDPDACPCQLIGGVTNEPDDGTQPVGSNVRIEASANAGDALLIELGGMSHT